MAPKTRAIEAREGQALERIAEKSVRSTVRAAERSRDALGVAVRRVGRRCPARPRAESGTSEKPPARSNAVSALCSSAWPRPGALPFRKTQSIAEYGWRQDPRQST